MDFTLILEGIAVLGIMGAVFGALLAFAAKIFHVEVDPKQEAVRECLAGANCGGCGYPRRRYRSADRHQRGQVAGLRRAET